MPQFVPITNILSFPQSTPLLSITNVLLSLNISQSTSTPNSSIHPITTSVHTTSPLSLLLALYLHELSVQIQSQQQQPHNPPSLAPLLSLHSSIYYPNSYETTMLMHIYNVIIMDDFTRIKLFQLFFPTTTTTLSNHKSTTSQSPLSHFASLFPTSLPQPIVPNTNNAHQSYHINHNTNPSTSKPLANTIPLIPHHQQQQQQHPHIQITLQHLIKFYQPIIIAIASQLQYTIKQTPSLHNHFLNQLINTSALITTPNNSNITHIATSLTSLPSLSLTKMIMSDNIIVSNSFIPFAPSFSSLYNYEATIQNEQTRIFLQNLPIFLENSTLNSNSNSNNGLKTNQYGQYDPQAHISTTQAINTMSLLRHQRLKHDQFQAHNNNTATLSLSKHLNHDEMMNICEDVRLLEQDSMGKLKFMKRLKKGTKIDNTNHSNTLSNDNTYTSLSREVSQSDTDGISEDIDELWTNEDEKIKFKNSLKNRLKGVTNYKNSNKRIDDWKFDSESDLNSDNDYYSDQDDNNNNNNNHRDNTTMTNDNTNSNNNTNNKLDLGLKNNQSSPNHNTILYQEPSKVLFGGLEEIIFVLWGSYLGCIPPSIKPTTRTIISDVEKTSILLDNNTSTDLDIHFDAHTEKQQQLTKKIPTNRVDITNILSSIDRLVPLATVLGLDIDLDQFDPADDLEKILHQGSCIDLKENKQLDKKNNNNNNDDDKQIQNDHFSHLDDIDTKCSSCVDDIDITRLNNDELAGYMKSIGKDKLIKTTISNDDYDFIVENDKKLQNTNNSDLNQHTITNENMKNNKTIKPKRKVRAGGKGLLEESDTDIEHKNKSKFSNFDTSDDDNVIVTKLNQNNKKSLPSRYNNLNETSHIAPANPAESTPIGIIAALLLAIYHQVQAMDLDTINTLFNNNNNNTKDNNGNDDDNQSPISTIILSNANLHHVTATNNVVTSVSFQLTQVKSVATICNNDDDDDDDETNDGKNLEINHGHVVLVPEKSICNTINSIPIDADDDIIKTEISKTSKLTNKKNTGAGTTKPTQDNLNSIEMVQTNINNTKLTSQYDKIKALAIHSNNTSSSLPLFSVSIPLVTKTRKAPQLILSCMITIIPTNWIDDCIIEQNGDVEMKVKYAVLNTLRRKQQQLLSDIPHNLSSLPNNNKDDYDDAKSIKKGAKNEKKIVNKSDNMNSCSNSLNNQDNNTNKSAQNDDIILTTEQIQHLSHLSCETISNHSARAPGLYISSLFHPSLHCNNTHGWNEILTAFDHLATFKGNFRTFLYQHHLTLPLAPSFSLFPDREKLSDKIMNKSTKNNEKNIQTHNNHNNNNNNNNESLLSLPQPFLLQTHHTTIQTQSFQHSFKINTLPLMPIPLMMNSVPYPHFIQILASSPSKTISTFLDNFIHIPTLLQISPQFQVYLNHVYHSYVNIKKSLPLNDPFDSHNTTVDKTHDTTITKLSNTDLNLTTLQPLHEDETTLVKVDKPKSLINKSKSIYQTELPTMDEVISLVKIQIFIWVVQYLLPFSLQSCQTYLNTISKLHKLPSPSTSSSSQSDTSDSDSDSNDDSDSVNDQNDGNEQENIKHDDDNNNNNHNLTANVMNKILAHLLNLQIGQILQSPWLCTQLYYALQLILFGNPIPRPCIHDTKTNIKDMVLVKVIQKDNKNGHKKGKNNTKSSTSPSSSSDSAINAIVIAPHHVLPFNWSLISYQSPAYANCFSNIDDMVTLLVSSCTKKAPSGSNHCRTSLLGDDDNDTSLSFTFPHIPNQIAKSSLFLNLIAPFDEITRTETIPQLQSFSYSVFSRLIACITQSYSKLMKFPFNFKLNPYTGYGVSTGLCANTYATMSTCLYSCTLPFINPLKQQNVKIENDKSSKNNEFDDDFIFHLTCFINGNFIATTAPTMAPLDLLSHSQSSLDYQFGTIKTNEPSPNTSKNNSTKMKQKSRMLDLDDDSDSDTLQQSNPKIDGATNVYTIESNNNKFDPNDITTQHERYILSSFYHPDHTTLAQSELYIRMKSLSMSLTPQRLGDYSEYGEKLEKRHKKYYNKATNDETQIYHLFLHITTPSPYALTTPNIKLSYGKNNTAWNIGNNIVKSIENHVNSVKDSSSSDHDEMDYPSNHYDMTLVNTPLVDPTVLEYINNATKDDLDNYDRNGQYKNTKDKSFNGIINNNEQDYQQLFEDITHTGSIDVLDKYLTSILSTHNDENNPSSKLIKSTKTTKSSKNQHHEGDIDQPMILNNNSVPTSTIFSNPLFNYFQSLHSINPSLLSTPAIELALLSLSHSFQQVNDMVTANSLTGGAASPFSTRNVWTASTNSPYYQYYGINGGNRNNTSKHNRSGDDDGNADSPWHANVKGDRDKNDKLDRLDFGSETDDNAPITDNDYNLFDVTDPNMATFNRINREYHNINKRNDILDQEYMGEYGNDQDDSDNDLLDQLVQLQSVNSHQIPTSTFIMYQKGKKVDKNSGDTSDSNTEDTSESDNEDDDENDNDDANILGKTQNSYDHAIPTTHFHSHISIQSALTTHPLALVCAQYKENPSVQSTTARKRPIPPHSDTPHQNYIKQRLQQRHFPTIPPQYLNSNHHLAHKITRTIADNISTSVLDQNLSNDTNRSNVEHYLQLQVNYTNPFSNTHNNNHITSSDTIGSAPFSLLTMLNNAVVDDSEEKFFYQHNQHDDDVVVFQDQHIAKFPKP